MMQGAAIGRFSSMSLLACLRSRCLCFFCNEIGDSGQARANLLAGSG